MKADYTVRLTGKDDLSKTIKNVQKELLDVGKATSQIDKINEKFERITKSSAPLKRQLRDLQNLMAQMNFDGLADTDAFARIAEEAGRVKDAIGDAAEATKRFSSDTMKLDAMIQGIQGVAAVTSIATGAMALFGTENKDVQKAILKVQATLSILNGVQSVANMLNKDSALMLRLKQIRMAASAAATTVETTAVVGNTVAVGANTVAMRAWNTAKAVGKALLGDWTGLLLIGVTTVAALSTAIGDDTDKLKEQAKSTEDASKAVEDFNKTLKDTYNGVIQNLGTKFITLQAQWESLKTTAEKTEWIKANSNAFSELGISLNSINDAEDLFIRNSEKMEQAIMLRAQAAVLQKKVEKWVETYLESGDDIDKIMAKHVAGKLANVQNELQQLFPTRRGNSTSTPRVRSSRTTRTTTTPKTEQAIRVDDSLARQAERQWEQRINKIEQLQERFNNLQRSQTTSTFDMYVGGDSDAMQNIQSQMNFNDSLLRQLKSIKQEYADLGLEGSEAYKEIAKEIFSVSLEQMNLGNQAQQIDKQTKKLEEQTKTWGEIGDAASATAGLISQFGQMSDDKGLQTAGIIAETIANILLGYSQATAQASSLGPFGWAAFAIAGLAQVASMIAQIHSLSGYAEGGIVGGDSTHGDTILARLNTGEMVLNKRQQRNLFDVLDNGGVGGGYTESTVKIKGSDLYLAIKNYKGVKNKTGLKTF